MLFIPNISPYSGGIKFACWHSFATVTLTSHGMIKCNMASLLKIRGIHARKMAFFTISSGPVLKTHAREFKRFQVKFLCPHHLLASNTSFWLGCWKDPHNRKWCNPCYILGSSST